MINILIIVGSVLVLFVGIILFVKKLNLNKARDIAAQDDLEEVLPVDNDEVLITENTKELDKNAIPLMGADGEPVLLMSNKEAALESTNCSECPLSKDVESKLCCRKAEYKPIDDPSTIADFCPYRG